jgi:hypothetical protein
MRFSEELSRALGGYPRRPERPLAVALPPAERRYWKSGEALPEQRRTYELVMAIRIPRKWKISQTVA